MQLLKKTMIEELNNQIISVRELNLSYEEVIKTKENCLQTSLSSINELLQYMTKQDYVREMILNVNQQAQMVEDVASSSEELAASIVDITSYVQESNLTINGAITDTSQSLSIVNDTFNQIERNINETAAIKEIMNEVSDETQKINDLVSVIKGVADQTNLLALNASIEAARAGEHGKGFAVVAGEIKKLAESTKKQVNYINDIVGGLNRKIDRAAEEIDRVVSTFNRSKTEIDQATSSIREIYSAMGMVNDSFGSITSSVEEQSATTQEMSAHLQVINEKSLKLREEAVRTGEAFFAISQKVDEIRIKAFQCAKEIDTNTMIELSITDHLMWKWRVYNMLLGNIKLDDTTVGDHHGCRLGKWIATLNQSNTNIKRILDQMEKPHCNIHRLAKEAIIDYNNGNDQKSELYLNEIEQNSNLVIKYLNDLRDVI